MSIEEIMNMSKEDIITKFGRTAGDTGSPEVQIAILTNRVLNLTEHMKEHKHDFHSPPWSYHDGWPASSLARLSKEKGCGTLCRDPRTARLAEISHPKRKGVQAGRLFSFSACRIRWRAFDVKKERLQTLKV